MPIEFLSCISLPPATLTSVPIGDFAEANEELADKSTKSYYPCCGKSICRGCLYSFVESGNEDKCPFCNCERGGKTEEEEVEEIMKRVAANDANSIYELGDYYFNGIKGLQLDEERAVELWTQAAKLGSSEAHFALGVYYKEERYSKKAKLHFEAAAMAGHDVARFNLGNMEHKSGKMERSVKHFKIAASAGNHYAMQNLLLLLDFEQGLVSRDAINSALTAYNNSCAEMRSEARDKLIRIYVVRN
jgi:TPR repeat protein